MEFFLLLGISTLIIAFFALLIQQKTKDISFLAGIGLLYFFTLFGAWFIVYDNLTLEESAKWGVDYYYLMLKMFPVKLDVFYFKTLVFYALFIIIIEIMLWLMVPSKKSSPVHTFEITINHWVILAIAGICLMGSFLINLEQLKQTSVSDKSAYSIIRHSPENTGYVIQQLLNRSVIVLTIGLVLLWVNNPPFIFQKAGSKGMLIFMYLFLIGIWVIYFSVLGSKNELFTAVLAGGLIYFSFARKVKYLPLFFGLGVTVIILGGINILRKYSPGEMLDQFNLDFFIASFASVLFSNEMMGAHLSMYGVLYYQVPVTWGYSFLSLLTASIPRFIWEDRPVDIYNYYATSVGALEGQGYTIHHATGWYLNFGIIGVIIGGMILGTLWGVSHRINSSTFGNNKTSALLSLFLPYFIVAGMPLIIRAGIEGYKSLLLDAIFMPLFMLFLTFKFVIKKPILEK